MVRPPDPNGGAEATILVVDDSDRIREVTSEMLRSAGFAVIEAADGARALDATRQRPDLIILDVHLPDIDGLEVCRRVKGRPETASIPLLHLSGTFRELEDRVRGLETGADGYLTKPVGAAELIAHVRALLRMRRMEADLGASEIRRHTAEALVEVGRRLAESLDAAEIARTIADSLRHLLAAEASAVFRLDPASGDLVAIADSGQGRTAWGANRVVESGMGLASVALRERCPVATTDLLADPRVRYTPEGMLLAQRSSAESRCSRRRSWTSTPWSSGSRLCCAV